MTFKYLLIGFYALMTVGIAEVASAQSTPVLVYEIGDDGSSAQKFTVNEHGSVFQEFQTLNGKTVKTQIAQLDSKVLVGIINIIKAIPEDYKLADKQSADPACQRSQTRSYKVFTQDNHQPVTFFSTDGCHSFEPTGPWVGYILLIKKLLDGIEAASRFLVPIVG